ncbi:MAG TPA: SDR family oxidoreductase [Gryllotalpicola sp.]
MSAAHHVVITGAGGVIGRWLARAFAADGAELVLVDARREALDAAIAAEAPGAVGCCVDLTSAGGRKQLVSVVAGLWGSADVLVNNAGVYPHEDLLKTSDEEMHRIFAINVEAPFALTRELAAQMIACGTRGAVINISSGAATVPAAGGGCYAASKAALEMFTRVFALELAPHGIRVNTVQPGFAPGSEVSELDEGYIARMSATIPLGRVSGPGDASAAVRFLASDDASFITGATIAVDGGRTAGTFRSAARPDAGNQ